MYAEYGGIVFAEEEGRNIAKALGEGNKVSFVSSLLFFGLATWVVRGKGANGWIVGGYFD